MFSYSNQICSFSWYSRQITTVYLITFSYIYLIKSVFKLSGVIFSTKLFISFILEETIKTSSNTFFAIEKNFSSLIILSIFLNSLTVIFQLFCSFSIICSKSIVTISLFSSVLEYFFKLIENHLKNISFHFQKITSSLFSHTSDFN